MCTAPAYVKSPLEASHEELIWLIVDALSPSIPKEDCRQQIEDILPTFEGEFCAWTGIAPRGFMTAALAERPATARETRDAHNDYAGMLERAATALPPGVVPEISTDLFCRAAKVHRHAAAQIQVRRKRNDGFAKKLCCAQAVQLMFGLSTKQPSATAGGPLLTVASLLWELLTGEHEVDLERHCRAILKANRPV